MKNRKTRNQKSNIKIKRNKEITRSNLRICELEKKLEKQKKFVRKSLMIRNLKIFGSCCNFISPYIICGGMTLVLSNALGSGNPFGIDEFDKYKTYYLNYETNDLIEYQENYEYNIDPKNVLKITTPWTLNKDGNYERVIKDYNVKYNSDKTLIDKLLEKDIEYIDEHYKSKETKKEITNKKLFETNDYVINANLTVIDKEDILSVKESETDNRNVVKIELFICLSTGTLAAFLRKFRLKKSINSINSEYKHYLEYLYELEGNLANEKEKIRVLMKQNNRSNKNGDRNG